MIKNLNLLLSRYSSVCGEYCVGDISYKTRQTVLEIIIQKVKVEHTTSQNSFLKSLAKKTPQAR